MKEARAAEEDQCEVERRGKKTRQKKGRTRVVPMRLIVSPLRDVLAKATPLSSPKGERRLSAEMYARVV